MRFDLGTLDSNERPLPFGLLVSKRSITLIEIAICYKRQTTESLIVEDFEELQFMRGKGRLQVADSKMNFD